VYRPSEADVIILVTSRPSEDLMAVYDGYQEPISNFLWRVMGRDGFSTVKLRWFRKYWGRESALELQQREHRAIGE
jgi:hypothetical protein